MKKLLSVLLAAVCLIGVLTACGNTGSGDTTTAPVADATTTPVTEFPPSDIPETLKFTDTTINFLYWKDVERQEFFADEITGEGVNDAIAQRNERVQNQFEEKFEWVGTPGNYGNQDNFVTAAYNSTQSGGDYDIFAGYSLTASTLALRNLTQNLKDYSVLDFSKPWWPESLISQATINNKLYFASGDISTNMLYMMYSCFFNKSIYKEVHADAGNMYDIVSSGKWTVAKLIELSAGCYQDINSNNVSDYGDRFGFMTIDLHFDAFFTGANLKTLEKNGEGVIIISPDFSSEKTMNLLNTVNTFLYSSGDAFAKGTTSTYSSAQAFKNGLTLFTMDRVYIASGTLKEDLDFEYGILPVPMYDEEQANYVTCMAFPYTMYSISTATKNADAAAATLALMGYESFCLITPALFEESMKLKYSDDLADAQMYDIIRENVYIDLGRVFTTSLGNLSYSLFRNAMKNNTASTWVSSFTTNGRVITAKLNAINKTMDELQ